jgi:hypothetical protein
MDEKSIQLYRFKRAVELLAAPASKQLAALPDGICKADELALEFDHWSRWLKTSGLRLDEQQTKALSDLDSLLSTLSGLGGEELWTDSAVEHDSRWKKVRELAALVLGAFQWHG